MAYKALYRTYRPSTFEEVAGQQHIVRTLKNALQTGKIAHAYLFAGPRGTGKTTMAKLFAKALNCEEGIGHQCNHCKNCNAINDGSHPDVLELDAASNNGVNQIREIIDRVKYGTIQGKYKVYIIDEVHMLSDAAFNALLKTLEEPPAHVIFILATTEPHEILPTILSRCQRYDFTKVSDDDIVNRMKIILEAEHIAYEEEAVKTLAALAEGGVRDALSMLDQVLAFSKNNELKTEDVLSMFSLESTEEKANFISHILDSDVSTVLAMANSYFTKGTDIKRLTDDLLTILKDVLLFMVTKNETYLQKLNTEQVNNLASKTNKDAITKMIDILMDTIKDYQTVSSVNSVFEVAILKLCSLFVGIAPHIDTPKAPETKIEESIKVEEKPIIVERKEKKFFTPDQIIELEDAIAGDRYEINNDRMIEIMAISDKNKKKEVTSKWDELKKLSTDSNFGTIIPSLISAHPLVANSKILILEYQMSSTAEKMNKREKQNLIQSAIYNACGLRLFTYCIDRSTSVDLQNKYSSLLQLGRLPKKDTITLKFKGE